MKKELLITCPGCQRTGFTRLGLRAHFCYGTATKGHATKSRKLTHEQWKSAVDAAEKEAA